MVTSHSRGNKIYFKADKWYYSEDNTINDDSKPCKRCGKKPTKEGFDACLGHIEGVTSACCGHGVEESYLKAKEGRKLQKA